MRGFVGFFGQKLLEFLPLSTRTCVCISCVSSSQLGILDVYLDPTSLSSDKHFPILLSHSAMAIRSLSPRQQLALDHGLRSADQTQLQSLSKP